MKNSNQNINAMICDLEHEVALSGCGQTTAAAAIVLIVAVIMR